jgi:transcriptional regulator with XRE-family HTH domain
MKGHGRLRLKVWRVEREKTQHQMARETGMNQTRYWQIENGEGLEPTKDEREAVAAALGVKVSDIAWPDVGVKAS